ncbi:DUF1998 domain-containing protein, partial [bacterium]|nr:DUF1998 domain-containing protein [bacterium]
CCILAGYPGSIMSLRQRAGRVGRRDEKSCVVLVAGYDQLDQYFARQPEKLLRRSVERALINRDNEHILRQHLPAAASEIPLMVGDPYLSIDELGGVLSELESDGSLVKSASGKQWFPGKTRPHSRVDLRNAGSSYDIVDASSLSAHVIGTISGNSVFRECHEGAVYLHRGEQYHVESLNLLKREIRVRPYRGNVYTMVRSEKETEILDVRKAMAVGSFVARVGMVRVTEKYTAYERRRLYSQELLSVEALDLPPQSYTTISCWIELPQEFGAELTRANRHFMGSIHALEHAVISLIPLHALCDRMDVGGISFTRHPQHEDGAVFFYDGYPGGAGIADCVFDVLEELLVETRDLISQCSCEEGCPSCVQSPKCGSGNKPLDKSGAIDALSMLLSAAPEELTIREVAKVAKTTQDFAWEAQDLPADKRVVVFDLETQKSADEVGGWREARQMRVAIGAVWDSQTGETVAYEEARIDELIEHLKRADLVCGFNNRRFDYEVLRGYTFDNLQDLPTLDLLDIVTASRGGRLKLDSLARATLKSAKSADGLQSIAWFKEGKIDLVRDYCIHDVEITRDLIVHALKFGYLDYEDKTGAPLRLPVRIKLTEYFRERRVES